ncbi:MAG TPA: radical SAM protein [Planctomycetaceae bacterium]|nr:radical SAM protein [Planctomycetaceae bacterium]
MRSRGGVLLVSCYELGHQPLGVAWPSAFLRRAGFDPACCDVSVEPLSRAELRRAAVVVVAVPMHTALQLGVRVARAVREENPQARVVFSGLYAVLNAPALLDAGAAACLGGEIEGELVALLESWERGEGQVSTGPRVEWKRQPFPVPDRSTLPGLDQYAGFESVDNDGHVKVVTAGTVEASRGCRHLCTHCPIPPVYGGKFVAVPAEVVLADIEQQVTAGAGHITFADPDFLNGPAHARRVARGLADRFPDVTFDFTAKVEHLVERGDVLPELVECGAAFVISAVEALADPVLEILEKGHTRDDVLVALERCREVGLPVRPTWVPFTPWTTRADYCEILEFIVDHGLVGHVDPVQFSIRLLVPPGSLLEEHPGFVPHRGELDAEAWSWRWEHPDPKMDALHREVAAVVETAACGDQEVGETFSRIAGLAGLTLTPEQSAATIDRRPVPRLTEDWFC